MGEIIFRLKKLGIPVILLQGVFDIIHMGHVGYARAAWSLNKNALIIVGVENDDSVRKNKGDARPINPVKDRLNILSEWRSNDLLFAFDDTPDYDRSSDFVARYNHLNPTAIAVASWDPHLKLKKEQAKNANTKLAIIDYKHENSTTKMLHAVGYREWWLETVNQKL